MSRQTPRGGINAAIEHAERAGAARQLAEDDERLATKMEAKPGIGTQEVAHTVLAARSAIARKSKTIKLGGQKYDFSVASAESTFEDGWDRIYKLSHEYPELAKLAGEEPKSTDHVIDGTMELRLAKSRAKNDLGQTEYLVVLHGNVDMPIVTIRDHKGSEFDAICEGTDHEPTRNADLVSEVARLAAAIQKQTINEIVNQKNRRNLKLGAAAVLAATAATLNATGLVDIWGNIQRTYSEEVRIEHAQQQADQAQREAEEAEAKAATEAEAARQAAADQEVSDFDTEYGLRQNRYVHEVGQEAIVDELPDAFDYETVPILGQEGVSEELAYDTSNPRRIENVELDPNTCEDIALPGVEILPDDLVRVIVREELPKETDSLTVTPQNATDSLRICFNSPSTGGELPVIETNDGALLTDIVFEIHRTDPAAG